MQSFNWVDIDGIRYSWDGQGQITCAGQFGYQASIAGDRLDAVEIENDAGDVAGTLHVDFAAASISYIPAMDAEASHNMILVGHELGQQEYLLNSFHPASLQELLGPSETIAWTVVEDDFSSLGTELPPHGHILSWDSFHFDDEVLLDSSLPTTAHAEILPAADATISISLDLTNQVLDQIPPLHDI
ncbi:hypothetical protein [Aeromonas enteropelogenes]|uniref:hypothetical protein n=1 Tax=Aeromonas enteropelogenes TaxID=29489 RepID=UPI003B9DF1C6